MSLHADAVNGHSGILHLLHHVVDAVALAGVALVVVVVEQQGVRVGLMGVLECLGNELIAAELEEFALAIGVSRSSGPSESLVGNSLVDHVPSVDNVFVAVDNSMNVVAQTLVEDFLLDGFALLVLQHPVGEL